MCSGLSSTLSRNLWDDWNENDPSFGMKDMFSDDSTGSNSSGRATTHHHTHHRNGSVRMSSLMNSAHSNDNSYSDAMELDQTGAVNRPHMRSMLSSNSGSEGNDLPRLNVGRSLSEDLVSLLDDSNELMFGSNNGAKQSAQRPHLGQSNSGVYYSNDVNHHQQQQLQQQLQQQQQQQQQQANNDPAASSSSSQPRMSTDQIARVAAVTLTAASAPCPQMQQMQAAQSDLTNSANAQYMNFPPTFGQQQQPVKDGGSGSGTPTSSVGSEDTTVGSSSTSSMANGISSVSNSSAAKNGSPNPAQATVASAASAAAPFTGGNGMMIPGFMMYSMPMMGNYPNNMGAGGAQGHHPMGMMPMGMGMNPMQMPMGMGMGMGLGMGMPMQMGMGMSMNPMQMAALNAMGIGMNMPFMDMNAAQQMQQQQANGGNPMQQQSNQAQPMETSQPTLAPQLLAKAPTPNGLAPKDMHGPGFIQIARKPEEPEVSSILKALMDEEAKKKEKKLERNRDSARESRKKQQTYVETLENGIKRLQINRELVSSYRWGVTGPNFGILPCPNSPAMYDWKNRIHITTGANEGFANIQNPTSFLTLMQMNRQRRSLALSHSERERAIAKGFSVIGRQLAALRQRVLEIQILRTFMFSPADNAAAAATSELGQALRLTQDQQLQLQCHAQRVLREEAVELVKLFKIFMALRNEAVRMSLVVPSLDVYFQGVCAPEQLHRLLQWTQTHRQVVEESLPLELP